MSTRVVSDIATGEILERDSLPYDGPLELAKGGNSKAEMQRANQLSDQQMGIMRDQLAMQKQQLAMVNPSLQAIIQNKGMLPEQEAAMRTQAMQGLGGQYKDLQGQLSQQLAARGITGGGMAGGGDIARSFGSLGAMEAGQQSELLNQIQLAKGGGLMNALSVGLGEGAMYGQQAMGFGGQGVNALGIGQQAGQAADQASTGFWGSLMGGLAGLGGSAMTAWCPAMGSQILMADGSEKAVELLRVGDQVMGIDDEPCTVEEVPWDFAETICVTFDDGHVTHNSPTHAFALPKGGFTVSAKSQGKQILTSSGVSAVLSVKRDGVKRVFNIITDGSHTYRADGVWALGVGDAERHVPMKAWAKIGEALIDA